MATDGAVAIRGAFARASADGRAALIPYAVAGYPNAAKSAEVAIALIDAGADLLEIGLPYSDPTADGLTLQRASGMALANGATLDRSIDLVARVHTARPGVPLIPMGYVNQVVGGRDGAQILARLAAAGASGLILADLTPDEGEDVQAAAAKHGISIIYLVTPTTPPASSMPSHWPE
jgi:tryptophan synthase alpha chain